MEKLQIIFEGWITIMQTKHSWTLELQFSKGEFTNCMTTVLDYKRV